MNFVFRRDISLTRSRLFPILTLGRRYAGFLFVSRVLSVILVLKRCIERQNVEYIWFRLEASTKEIKCNVNHVSNATLVGLD